MADAPAAAPQPAGLINQAPAQIPAPATATAATPATNPVTAPAPVTPYTPATAQAQNASAASYTPNAYSVTPQQTTAGQLQNIISSGSPLMQQAEANARNLMNQRGLINSSIGVGASEGALIAAAEPIAAADANTYAQAATNTTNAQNTALASEAAAKNAASLQNASLATQTSQFNSGQGNAALAQAQQINAATAIQKIQSDTSLSIADKQAAEQTLLAGLNNENARVIQQMQNDSSMQNILANGVINTNITNLTNQNKLLLQSSSGAATLYNQALSYMSSIATDVNLSADDKAAALNNAVQTLNDALSALSDIGGTPSVMSLLNFTPPPGAANTNTGTAGGLGANVAAAGYNASNPALLQLLGGSLNGGGANGNSTPLQDIARAMAGGATITDSEWAQAGLPPGGGTVGAQLKSAIFGNTTPAAQAA